MSAFKKIKKIIQTIIKKQRIFVYAILFFCFCLAMFIVFYKLGFSAMENWDEAWYADIVRHMLRTKEFFVTYWNSALLLDKPPLYMWLTVIVAKIIGLSEFSVRFVSALAGLATILLVLFSSYRLFGLIPALIAFSTLALNNIYVWRVRSGNLDSLLTFLFVLSYFLMISKKKYRYLLLGATFGLMYLTKLTVVIFPLAVFAIQELIYENTKMLSHIPAYLKSAAIFVLLAGIWLYVGTQKAGPDFYKYYLYRADQGVSNISLTNFKTDYLNYTYYSLQRRFFWLALIGLGFALFKLKDRRYFIQILFATGLLIQLSLTTRNNNWYLMPSMPFWSMLAALATYQLFQLFTLLKKRRPLYLLMAVFIILSLYISYKTFKVNIMALINSEGPVKMKASSLEINSLSKDDDQVARLDNLYPTTIYYADRKTWSSPDKVDTTDLFISRHDLKQKLQSKEIKWVVGVNGDIDAFLKDQDKQQYDIIKVNDEETILHVH